MGYRKKSEGTWFKPIHLLLIFAISVSLLSTVILLSPVKFGVSAKEDKPVAVSVAKSSAVEDSRVVKGVVIVKFKDAIPLAGGGSMQSMVAGVKVGISTGIQSIDNIVDKYDVYEMDKLFEGTVQPQYPNRVNLSRIYYVRFPTLYNPEDVAGEYQNDPNVEWAQVDMDVPVDATNPNDTYYQMGGTPPYQWPLKQTSDHDIDAPEAWDLCTGSTEVILAIVDTGVDWDHPDLAGNIWTNEAETAGNSTDDDANGFVDDIRGWDWVNLYDYDSNYTAGEDTREADNNPMDYEGHGTHCSGIVSAVTNNNAGLAGVNWNAKIMPCRVGWMSSSGGGVIRMSFAAQAIQYAASMGATAINCSFGNSNSGGLGAAVDFAVQEGVLVICSAGNDDITTPSYLGSRSDCVAVAATEWRDLKAGYSNYGSWVDISAPGGTAEISSYPYTDRVISTDYNNAYSWRAGTSMAAPHVVGLAGLIKAHVPGITGEAIKAAIYNSAEDIDSLNPGYSGQLGAGRINAFYALLEAAEDSDGTGTVVNDPANVTPESTHVFTFTLEAKVTEPVFTWEVTVPFGWTVNSNSSQIQASLGDGCAGAGVSVSSRVITIEGCDIHKGNPTSIGSFRASLTASSEEGSYSFSNRTAGEFGTLGALYESTMNGGGQIQEGGNGYIHGNINLSPSYVVSVEVEAYNTSADVKGNFWRTSTGDYMIGGLPAGSYYVEAHAQGYEVRRYGPFTVVEDATTEAGSLTLGTGFWKRFGNKWNANYSPDPDVIYPLLLKWELAFPSGPSDPVIANKIVYFAGGASDDQLYAVWGAGSGQPEGTIRWSIPMPGNVARPIVYDRKVYTQSLGDVYSVNEDGTINWSVPMPGGLKMIVDGMIYVGTGTGVAGGVSSLSAFPLDNPTVNKWYVTFEGHQTGYTCAKSGDSLFIELGVGSWGGDIDPKHIYALDDADGSIQWSCYVGSVEGSGLSYRDGIVYIPSGYGYNNYINRVNANTGAFINRWAYQGFGTGVLAVGVPVPVEGRVYFKQDHRHIYCYDEPGSFRWSYIFIQNYPGAGLAVLRDIVISSANDSNTTSIFSKESGAILWSGSAGFLNHSGDAPISDYRFYTRETNHDIYCWETARTLQGDITLVPDNDVSVEVTVWKDGQLFSSTARRGSGFYQVLGLNSGVQTVEVSAPGYESKVEAVTIAGVGTTTRNFTLNPSWPSFMGGKWNSGFSAGSCFPPIGMKWSYTTQGPVKSSPAVVGDVVYFGSQDNALYAVWAESNALAGQLRWSYITSGTIESSPLVVNDYVYFGSMDGSLYAVDYVGNFKWSYTLAEPITCSPNFAESNIYITSSDNNIYSLNRFSGDFKWSFYNYDITPADLGGVFPLTFNRFYPAKAATGMLYCVRDRGPYAQYQWMSALNSYLVKGSSFSDGVVYAGTYLRQVYALRDNGTSVTQLWTYQLPVGVTNRSEAVPTIGSDSVYLGFNNSILFALNRSDGAFKWSYVTSGGIKSSAALTSSNYLFFGSDDNMVYAVRDMGASPQLWWSFQTGGNVNSSPAISAARLVYVGSDDCNLYCFLGDDYPYVVSTVPSADSTGVDIHSTVEVTFSDAMDQISSEASFSIYPTFEGTFSWEAGNFVMNIDPDNPLPYRATYIATVSTVARDETGDNVITAETFPFEIAAIADPVNFLVSMGATGGELDLSWFNPDVYDFQGYMVRYSTEAYPASTLEGVLVTWEAGNPGSYETYSHSGLSDMQTYFYTAFSYDSQPTYSLGVTALGTPEDITPPADVTNFIATREPTGGQLNLSWTNPDDADFEGILLLVSLEAYPTATNDAFATVLTREAYLPSTKGYFEHTGLSNETYYYYKIFAFDEVPNYSNGVTTREKPVDSTPPEPVQFFDAIGLNFRVQLIWGNPTSEYTGTRIVGRGPNDRFPTNETDGTIIYDGPGTSTTEYGLNNGDHYFYGAWAYDAYGNFSTPLFDSATPEGDNEPPTITHVRFSDRVYFPNDVIPSRPNITATIEDNVAVATIEIQANEYDIYTGTAMNSWLDEELEGTAVYNTVTGSFEYDLNLGRPLPSPPVGYRLTIEAYDFEGNATYESFSVRIYSGDVQVIGDTLSYPVPFRPLAGERATIAYTLTDNADVTIVVTDVALRPVMTRKFSAGAEGGRLGYNQISWDGISDIGGQRNFVGNGIYVYQIIYDRKVLAKGKIVVFDKPDE